MITIYYSIISKVKVQVDTCSSYLGACFFELTTVKSNFQYSLCSSNKFIVVCVILFLFPPVTVLQERTLHM